MLVADEALPVIHALDLAVLQNPVMGSRRTRRSSIRC